MIDGRPGALRRGRFSVAGSRDDYLIETNDPPPAPAQSETNASHRFYYRRLQPFNQAAESGHCKENSADAEEGRSARRQRAPSPCISQERLPGL